MADKEDKRALIFSLSGCSSSGKTTLARILRDILPNTFILHEDDFYKTDNEIPVKNGIADWDCAGAIDIPGMAQSLVYIRQHAEIPPTLDSKEDQNSVGKCPVPDATIDQLKAKVASAIPATHPLRQARLRVCLLDGFLLYSESISAIKPSLDLKIFLRASYERAKFRREARDGYVTLEGFWKDPPGYVDDIVWPNYIEEHAWMFEGGDVEGKYKLDELEKEGIKVPPGEAVDADMTETLDWIVQTMLDELSRHQ